MVVRVLVVVVGGRRNWRSGNSSRGNNSNSRSGNDNSCRSSSSSYRHSHFNIRGSKTRVKEMNNLIVDVVEVVAVEATTAVIIAIKHY